jgi:hypothetical protein
MAENKETNNSLSDLNRGNGLKFNRLLTDDEIRGRQTSKTDNDNLRADTTIKTAKLQSSKDAKEVELLQQQINTNNTILNNSNNLQIDRDGNRINKKSDFSLKSGNNPTSLFDRDAMIDYARYINTDGSVKADWKEYSKDKNGNFKINNQKNINEPVFFRDNSLFKTAEPNFSNEGLSIENLITWSEKYPALQLRFQDFVYCKRLGYYPNNRLIILRRFKGGVPDNLFDYYKKDSSKLQYTQPLSTMITWLTPDDDIIDMSFNESWKPYSAGFLETVKNALSDFRTDGDKYEKDKASSLTQSLDDLITSLAIDEIAPAREDGVPFTRSIKGNPNLIKNAMKRDTDGAGLKSSIIFELTFEYELRFINNVDPSIAILDLMSNAMRMGTSESEFRYNIPFLKDDNTIKNIINGDMAKLGESLIEDIKKFTDSISKKVKNLLNNNTNNNKTNVGENNDNVLKKSAEYILSKYRENLKAAFSVDTGLPSGIWHVTIGNPKAPIISCGDLIISKSTLKLGKELGYNDFPNSFSVTYTLTTARERGRNELIRIFNNGRGRLYVYPTAKHNPDYDLY